MQTDLHMKRFPISTNERKTPQGMRQAHGTGPCAAVFFHPDFPESAAMFRGFPTVGSGIGPDLLTCPASGEVALAGSRVQRHDSATAPTAGGESHPALKTLRVVDAGEPACGF